MPETASSSQTPESALPWKPIRQNHTPFPTDPLAGIKPKLYMVAGRPVKFYGIGALAKVLNRKSDTIRGWEQQGWLPKPTAAFPGLDPRDPASARHGRRRLYTRAQILAIFTIANEEGILQPHGTSITQTNFIPRVKKAFQEIALREREERARLEQKGAAQ